ncbi:uncharacterized protein FFB20_07834 [Fusarium fujikuroi]|uniref:Uncharacterized protein n=2 Tax=Fusarium fujikuroi TaxID=5127 RepID=S0DW36_GIBF5|nr:uncharacterized protein FFUJ_02548 [Fusarium fujikuroi IMI 58289]KLP08162.1 uncharacterized protein Y057_11705 [Fusarium fujikuroi]KLP18493.1 uncharacterized protein LW94_923 [Fusarium fujikuroi]QGI61758.1 hypothetical protein CEK27_005729 [Fusarium fujikuroi]QGI78944.1 hypothetical protein CEK25_005673 [Fusarium fujikuroi]QGI92657.1 hypothetical protein CEK26_005726 [Fusarium fujikuroi]
MDWFRSLRTENRVVWWPNGDLTPAELRGLIDGQASPSVLRALLNADIGDLKRWTASRHFALFCEVQLGFKVNTVNSTGEIIDGAAGIQKNAVLEPGSGGDSDRVFQNEFHVEKTQLNIPADEALGRLHLWARRELDIERVPIRRDGKTVLYFERYMNPEQNACLPLPARIVEHAEQSAEALADSIQELERNVRECARQGQQHE